jgi:predicted XRE-type DNA-binding protein
MSMPKKEAEVVWEGDSLDIIRRRGSWRRRRMKAKRNEPSHVTRGNVFADLGFSSEEAAVLAIKTQLHIEIIKVIEKRQLTPRQLERLLQVPQPRVSELINGKISRMTADLLTKYLHRLGREVRVSTKAGTMRAVSA